MSEQEKSLLTYEVAEGAKAQIVSWAKWIIGTVVLVIAILGVKTYLDVQSKITTVITGELEIAKNKLALAISSFEAEKNTSLASLDDAVKQAETKIQTHVTSIVSSSLPEYLSGSSQVLIRTIYDAGNKRQLPGVIARREGEHPTGDPSVDRVYENIGIISTFFSKVFNYNFAGKNGGEIIATVHYGKSFNNSFWDGNQIVFGDGDEIIFNNFTSLDIVTAELMSIPLTGKLVYQGEPGAVHSHIRDVFATMVVQWQKQQTVEQADWLIGKDSLGPNIKGVALRSLKSPGTAYADPILGKDPQPFHMDSYVNTTRDSSGVHINSGILNHAFYLSSMSVGGNSWEEIGTIWFSTIDKLHSNITFRSFAKLTHDLAIEIYGDRSREALAIHKSWEQVGIVL